MLGCRLWCGNDFCFVLTDHTQPALPVGGTSASYSNHFFPLVRDRPLVFSRFGNHCPDGARADLFWKALWHLQVGNHNMMKTKWFTPTNAWIILLILFFLLVFLI